MTLDEVFLLLPLVERQLCGILIENKICKYKTIYEDSEKLNTYRNLEIIIKINELVSLSEVDELRQLIPIVSRRGDRKIIYKKINNFLKIHKEYNFDIIKKALEFYINKNILLGNSYIYNLNNIFAKRENGINKYPILGIIEEYKEANKKNNNNINIEEDIDI